MRGLSIVIMFLSSFLYVNAQKHHLYGNAGIQALIGGKTSAAGTLAIAFDSYSPDFKFATRLSISTAHDTVRSNHIAFLSNPEALPYSAAMSFSYRAPVDYYRPIAYVGTSYGGGAMFGYSAEDPTSTGAFTTAMFLAEAGIGLEIDSALGKLGHVRVTLGFSYRRIGGELGTISEAPLIPGRLVDPTTMRTYILQGASSRAELHGIDLLLDLHVMDKARLFCRATGYNDHDYNTITATVGVSVLTSLVE